MKNVLILLIFAWSFVSCSKDNDEVIIPPVNNDIGTSELIQDEFEGVSMVLVGNPNSNFIVAFNRRLEDGTLLDFSIKQRSLPVIMTDQEGNEWTVEGIVDSGPREGQRLTSVNSYIGFWFAWGTMYPGIELYNGPAFNSNFTPEPVPEDWLIPTDNVFTVLGVDAIPAIDNPQFEAYDEKRAINNGYFLEDEELVVGVTIDNETRLYPHRILNWHEIVNDQIGDFYFAMSFCPLTGTAIMWDRNIAGEVSTFGVSGLLYNGNLMSFDRNTESIWSQMKQDCVRGKMIGERKETFQVLETTWRTWKELYESPKVLTTDTGHGKDYSINPYQGYLDDPNHLSYPVEYKDNRLPLKERVLGVIINGKAKAYQFKDFD